MALNYNPLKSNVGSLVGNIYFKPDGFARAHSLGYATSFTLTPEVDSEDIFAPVDGKRSKIGTRTREIGGTVSAVFMELRPELLAAAAQGTLAVYTQTAVTAQETTITSVVAGEIHDLDAINVTAVSLTDGTDALVLGTDYTLNASSGIIRFLTSNATVVITHSAPAILEAAGRALITMLTSAEGLLGEVLIEGRNPDGKRFKTKGMRVALRASGDVPLSGDGADLTNIELEGSVEINENDPDAPYGYIVELD